eukprot:jgi/Tetstr1/424226/TSEL_000156.t1
MRGRAYETTNFRAAPDGCYCRCIIGERSGDREEGECIIRISSLPTGSLAASSISSWRPTRCTDGDGDKGSRAGMRGRAYETTNFRAAPDGCYCRCIIGERSGDREEGECIIRISSLPTGNSAASSMCMSSMGSPLIALAI